MYPLYQAFRREARANKEAGQPLQSVEQVIQLPANQQRIQKKREEIRQRTLQLLRRRATTWSATLFGLRGRQNDDENNNIEFERLDLMKQQTNTKLVF